MLEIIILFHSYKNTLRILIQGLCHCSIQYEGLHSGFYKIERLQVKFSKYLQISIKSLLSMDLLKNQSGGNRLANVFLEALLGLILKLLVLTRSRPLAGLLSILLCLVIMKASMVTPVFLKSLVE